MKQMMLFFVRFQGRICTKKSNNEYFCADNRDKNEKETVL